MFYFNFPWFAFMWYFSIFADSIVVAPSILCADNITHVASTIKVIYTLTAVYAAFFIDDVVEYVCVCRGDFYSIELTDTSARHTAKADLVLCQLAFDFQLGFSNAWTPCKGKFQNAYLQQGFSHTSLEPEQGLFVFV